MGNIRIISAPQIPQNRISIPILVSLLMTKSVNVNDQKGLVVTNGSK